MFIIINYIIYQGNKGARSPYLKDLLLKSKLFFILFLQKVLFEIKRTEKEKVSSVIFIQITILNLTKINILYILHLF
jgi:hypothetical protein